MPFAKEKHVRYWRMCAQKLPDHYMSNDSSRVTLGFFILSALDLLGALDTFDADERESWVDWVYSCQTPEGGFRGFTGTDLRDFRSEANSHWDPASVPATFFALATLLTLGDDLSRVKREECLAWLPRLQRADGSFGELLSENGVIEGDRDLRQCCCAAGIAYMLHGTSSAALDDIRLMQYIQSCQDMNGGFGVSPLREPHSGLSYCAIAALSLIAKLRGEPVEQVFHYVPDGDQCIKWFLERQTNVIDDEDDEDEEDEEEPQANNTLHRNVTSNNNSDIVQAQAETKIAGFNGREGKMADTCYAFWNGGALAILKREDLIDSDAMRQYLLDVTQHQIGGFGKVRDAPPDVLHSYMGLAALALFGQPGVQDLDPTMCISRASAMRLNQVSWKARP